MVERVRNILKSDRKKGKRLVDTTMETPPPKRQARDYILRRYPVGGSPALLENPETTAEHKKAISMELSKGKPRDSVLLPLMKSTFGERRIFILSTEVSVYSILQEYAALSRPAMVRTILKDTFF